MFRLKFNSLFFAIVMILCLGCGDGKLTVSGIITYEGESPESGTIAFIGDLGAGTVYGGPYTSGQYTVRVPEGLYRVRITGVRTITLDEPIPGPYGAPPITTRNEQIVPPEYGGVHSTLQVEVSRTALQHDFVLPTSNEQ